MHHSTFPNLSFVLEGITLAGLAAWQGGQAVAVAISEQDWQKAFGPNGVAFVAVIAVVVLWGALLTFIHRSKKDSELRRKEELEARANEDAARERRHKEIMDLQNKNGSDLKDLTAESIKANMRGTFAVETLAKNLQALTCDLADRPCQAAAFKPTSQPCPAPVNNPQ